MRRFALVVFAMCCIARNTSAQSILTVAGGGPIGDGGPATEAILTLPTGVAVDGAGNVFIADTTNHRVRRVDAQTGTITTIAGGGSSGLGDGGPATAAEVLTPLGVTTDPAGNVYVSQQRGAPFQAGSLQEGIRVRKIDRTTGIITTFAGGGQSLEDEIPATAAVLISSGLTFNGGKLYIADSARIRQVDANGVITTVAGRPGMPAPGFSGDGGPATAAQFTGANALAFDSKGNLFIADTGNHRIRRVDVATGVITTVAGTGAGESGPDGGQATATAIRQPLAVVVDTQGHVFLSESLRVRRIDGNTGVITTVAGQAIPGFEGDGGPATQARLSFPAGIALDGAGNLYIVDPRNQRIRRIERQTQRITTFAGGGSSGDGGPATSAALFRPRGVAVDSRGNIFATEEFGYRLRKVDASTGMISTIFEVSPTESDGPIGLDVDNDDNVYVVAGAYSIVKLDARTGGISVGAGTRCCGFAGDGGPATAATLDHPQGVHVDAAKNIYIADRGNNRIRRVDARTGIITTVAGSGPAAQPNEVAAGDGGPATAAKLNNPTGSVTDAAGNLYIADALNCRVRRVDAATGIITTIAGDCPNDVEIGPDGNLYFSSNFGFIARLDLTTGLSSPFVGSPPPGYTGDGGPATKARLNSPGAVRFDSRGNLFIADTNNNRIRAVFACVTVAAPMLIAPADGATALGTAPTLSWSAVAGAFRYDVFLSTNNPPATLVASDITTTSFTPSNLQPGVRYFWQVLAKGDPFCPSVSTAPSAVHTFNTGAICTASAAFDLTSPADGAQVNATTELRWAASVGAGSYDVLLGTTNPPPLIGTTSATSFTATNLSAGSTYFWSIVARAACDSSLVTSAPIRSFRVGGACPMPGAFTQIAPANGAQNVSTMTTLEWSASANASSYDLYLGTTTPPPIYLLDLTTTRIAVSGFSTGQTYFWRVVAKVACDASRTASTTISQFTIRRDCGIPRSTSFTFVPPSSVAVGQSYVVAWQDAAELEADGHYIVERSQSESFATIVDSQETASTSASFVAPSAGIFYHRVRPVNRCGTTPAPAAAIRSVSVIPAAPNVVFTVQPEAVLTTLGENLEDKRTRFVVENIGSETLSVLVGRQEIDSPPFFSIFDPRGGDSTFLTLQPRVPKELEIRFSGPPNDVAASYQGIIFLASLGKGLAITPYGFVNLRVGGGQAVAPEFRKDGLPSEYIFFPGFAGDDANRPPVTIDIRNSGATPMELGEEIGPEVWMVPESRWNETAIPPGATRTVQLFTRRARAPNGSALPRYTYFTVRTKSGQSARLLVQDNETPPVGSGRVAALDPSIRSLIIPEVSSANLGGGSRLLTVLRLSNVGSEATNTELLFTPAGADGYDATRVQRATIIVPPNDVVTLTDPLVQLWGLQLPAKGQIEVRAAPERIGQLAVSAIVTQTASGGGLTSYTIPTISRGEGARSGVTHVIPGISSSTATRAALVLAETSGIDRVSIRATLMGSEGNQLGERIIDLGRYSMSEIDDIAANLAGGASLDAARLELTVAGGGGSAIGVIKLLDRTSGGGATLVSRSSEPLPSANLRAMEHRLQPVPPPAKAGAPLLRGMWRRLRTDQTAPTRTFLLPAVFSGSSGGAPLQTTLGLYAARDATTFNLTYREGDSTRTASVTVQPRRIVEYANVLQQLFGLSSSEGSMLIETTGAGDVYARLTSVSSATSRVTVSQTLPVIAGDSEFVTTPTSQRPLYFDGLEQSVDSTRGTNWSLILNEISGKAAIVIVRIYEAGNRSAPIAQKEFPLAALQRLKLPSVFGALDLDSINRRKDRTNMLVSVVYKSGAGAATAIAMATDNRTGDSKSFVLSPASASSPFSVQRAIALAPKTNERRRGVRH